MGQAPRRTSQAHTVMTSQSIRVRCPDSCVCWPDGDFNDIEQGILEAFTRMIHRQTWDTADLAYALRQVTPRRLAHLMAVPVLVDNFQGAASFMYAAVNCPDEALQWLQAQNLPLCPQVGTASSGWSRHDARAKPWQHPGRAPSQQTMSLVHDLTFGSALYSHIVLSAGAYPQCGCFETTSCRVVDRAAVASKAVAQWHRWQARRARRMCVCFIRVV